MFNDSKYSKWYFAIINHRVQNPNISGLSENHHITPRALGGLDVKENLVRLSLREHFVCHRLLIRMTEGRNKRKMAKAYSMMSDTRKIKCSKDYELAKAIIKSVPMDIETRLRMSLSQLGKKHSGETKKKISASLFDNVNAFGVKYVMSEKPRKPRKSFSEDHRALLSAAAKNRKPISEETRQKLRDAKLGKPRTIEAKKAIAEGMRSNKITVP